jgi:hypothetical protein
VVDATAVDRTDDQPTDLAAEATRGGPPSLSMDIPPNVTEGLAGLQREKIAKEGEVVARTFAGLDRDRERAERVFNASSIGPDDIKPWNAEAEFAKRTSDPLERFGSLASVVGILGSAFTHQPLINSLNASAAAMEATKAGEVESYKQAHEAWKDNAELVIKRQQMMHQHYQDALDLMKTDLVAGESKMRVLATQFGDKQALFLTENGMNPELMKLIEERNKASLDYAQHLPAAMQAAEKQADLMESTQGLQRGSPEYVQAVHDWNARWDPYATRRAGTNSADQEFIRRFYAERPDATTEEFTAAFGEFKKGQKPEKTLTPDQTFVQKFFDENPNASTADFGKAFDEYKAKQKPAANAPVRTPGRANQEEIDKRIVAKEAAGMPHEQAFREAHKEVASDVATVTGNRREQLEGHIQQYDNAIALIDKNAKVLEHYVGAAGIAGRVTRTGERLSNIFGGNQTDRVQFMRDIEQIQAMAPQLLLDRAGRPLSSEAAKVTDIVAGINLGDTTANTMRALKDLKVVLRKMQADARGRLEGKGTELAPAAAAPETPNADAPWLNDPVKH